MNNLQMFSRRPAAVVDFRPDPDPTSPSSQLRRLNVYMETEIPPRDDISDCPDALNYLRELSYRKIFTGTSHAEFMALDKTEPEAIDWLIAVHSVDASNFQNKRNNK